MTKLNTNQQQAVFATEGYVLILAGAGSGKTRVLVHRIAHLISDLKIPPSSILGLTFTNKAAGEMRSRIGTLVDPKLAKQVTLSTFHSFCMKILRKEIHHLGFTSEFSLYDERDMKRLMMQNLKDLLVGEEVAPSIEPFFLAIAQAKSQRLSEDELPSLGSKTDDDRLKKLYQMQNTSMRAYNGVDFDSLLSLTVELFEKNPSVLEKYQSQYRYIMIDEYQDTNLIQYTLATLLAKKYGNLCVVGDDDQSIYAWRGAEIKHILNFPATTTIKLERNYRSTSRILDAANAVIQNNQCRHDKQLKPVQGEGDTIEIFHAPTDDDEVQAVIDRILLIKKEKGLKWNEIAILYRSNILSRPFELALINVVWRKGDQFIRGIPYQVFGGTEFFEKSEIKDLMAYLRVISNPKDQEALLRIINYPRRGISDKSLDILTQFNRKNNLPLIDVIQGIETNAPPYLDLKEALTMRAIRGIESFMKVYREAKEKFQTIPLHQALASLVETIDYKNTILEEVKSDKMRGFKWENVEACIQALKNYEEGELEENSLHDFLATTLLDDRKHKKKNQIEEKLNLMTFHSAKGLEFPACFLVGLEENIIPHERSFTKEGIEEERRLMYVAITRAMNHLYLSMAQKRKYRGKLSNTNPSRFLFEIPKELLNVTPWKSIL